MEAPIRALLQGNHFGQLGTVNPDNSPHIDTVWYAWEDDKLRVCTTRATLKAKNLLINPKAYMVITHRDNPYEQAQIALTLDAIDDDNDLSVCDRIADRYTGRPFPQRHLKGRIVLSFRIDKLKYHIARV
ncbi:Uncharacterised protein [BD1-7 clade bacterium]|uniref:Pyridoxamine 5'-phosphate oxidase N-terminal domain-containing protein n=1 Tax=BD1-7 clade bacterium TaxID=2029982 RepID=A0A5S9QRJ1_9GAMM|nr:Uncharacterised protein [BD1-7 clade bacterium]